jgi:hypothetical protein
MGFCENFRRRRLELTGRESAETLEHMQDYFQDGENWTQGMYENANGARCLVGAANHVRVSSIDDAKHWLRLAIAEVMPGAARIEDFNDGCRTFAEVAAVIERARQLAAQSSARVSLPPPVPALPALPELPKAEPEILPPRRQALPADDAPPVLLDPPRLPRVRARRRRDLVSWIME